MAFNKIDLNTWQRKDSYEHYFTEVPNTYSMTVNIDITHFLKATKKKGQPFFPSFLHCLAVIVNRHQEFKMDLDDDKNLGFYDVNNPGYTIFHEETESLTYAWTEFNENIDIFLESYKNDMAIYRNNTKDSKPQPKNVFPVSCMPWTTFTGFNLNLQKGFDYLPPIFTLAKYFTQDDKTLVPLAMQVHHAVCDGFHSARFINELQELIYN